MLQPTQILQEAQQTDIFRPSIFEFGANLFVALTCGTLISLVYRFIRRKTNPPPAFANALVLLSLITAIVTLVIGNNLARAFGLVGTMSIIRFRTAVRDVEDIVFIFFSLAMGMAAGVGLNSIALLGTALVGVVILLLHAFSDAERPVERRAFLHVVHGDVAATKAALPKAVRRYGRRVKALSTRPLPDQQAVEVFYQFVLRAQALQPELLRAVLALEAVTTAHLFFEASEVAQNGPLDPPPA